MGEKGNFPAETASTALGERALEMAGNLAGTAVTKTVEVTVAGVVEGARKDKDAPRSPRDSARRDDEDEGGDDPPRSE